MFGQPQQQPKPPYAPGGPPGYGGATPYQAYQADPEAGWPQPPVDGEWAPNPCANLPPAVRLAFMRKVFAILTVQLAVIAASASFIMLHPDARHFVLTNHAVTLAAIFAPLGFIVALSCYQHRHPHNLLLLGGFTLCMSYSVGVVCAATYAAGLGAIVWQALLIAAVVFLALTNFMLLYKHDFSNHGVLLGGLLMVLIIVGLFVPFFGPTARLLYSGAGALLFTGYILVDLSMLMHHHGPDDYVPAAIALYLDVVNLFLYTLEMLRIFAGDR
ncbi:hypothetical protein EMIHUDRAFT_358129 [Emiliania huxleyi CCMP1516]|uniref:Uncharacterized protein n=2 Tax=Emiliania huxleyi TaxID=2903 RepID=A0A0D3IHG8_EMIH1|nr:hypothetical protein EMIHUDRAFT_358129 [Emiliania huxleyi CCMP1516]EOD10703.1 hypothetical protein EMIHUDRAFT_358129 [Emiliania huxleyi CCMP1516]|eukprot:XP_005763132.1 hypothetical protein EMIHUDRAFT_358129 [Emiliania huxleyi CCMP1516]